MAEFGHPDRHRQDVQNALILIWQENVIWRSFFMINILVTLRECSHGRILSSRQTQKRCPECSDARLARPRMKGLQSEADGMTACKTTWRSLKHRNGEQHLCIFCRPIQITSPTTYCRSQACGVCATGCQEIALSA